MTAQVDSNNCVVCTGDKVWAFDIDCRSDVARIVIDTRCYTLRPLGWREKRNLARYCHLGESFLENQFLRVSVADDTNDLPDIAEHRAVLSALARWLNAPDGNTGLPLDRQLLAAVTLDVCRAMQLAPAIFDALDAAEVEMLWQSTRAERERPSAIDDRNSTAPNSTAPTNTDNELPAMTRIVVVNDREFATTAKPTTTDDVEKDNQAAIAESSTAPTNPKSVATNLTPSRESTLGAVLLSDSKPVARMKPRHGPVVINDSVAIKRQDNATTVMPNRFRFNLAAAPQIVEPLRVQDHNVEIDVSAFKSEISARVPIAPMPITAAHNADIARDVELVASPSQTPSNAATMHRDYGDRLDEAAVMPPYVFSASRNDDHWLTVFAERLDEAAKAGGIDLEN